MMKLNNNVVNNLANVTPTQTVCATTALSNITSAGNTKIQTQAKSVCATKAMDNLTSAGKLAVEVMAYPSANVVDLGVPGSGTSFTAESTGWVEVRAFKSSGTGPGVLAIRDTTSFVSSYVECNSVANTFFYTAIPTTKGHTVALYYSNVQNKTGAGAAIPAAYSFVQLGGGG